MPKGPSYDPADRRMAVEVEDHPVEYADFEGLIPAGNYGAGAVIVWDRGAWTPRSDPRAGLEHGKLVFELAGHKLRGEWTLVRTRPDPGGKQQWLLLKHRDAYAGPGREVPQESIVSGLALEELAAGVRPGGGRGGGGEAARGPARAASAGPGRCSRPQAPSPPAGAAWLFEPRYDGYRVLARRDGARATIRYARGGDATVLFPEVARAVERLGEGALVDGELVVLGPDGRPSPAALRERAALARREHVERALVRAPATLFAFDLLALGGLDLRPLPLRERKRLLAAVAPRVGALRYADHVEGRGEELLREVDARGLPGVVAKRADAPYRAGRSPAWRTVRAAGGRARAATPRAARAGREGASGAPGARRGDERGQGLLPGGRHHEG